MSRSRWALPTAIILACALAPAPAHAAAPTPVVTRAGLAPDLVAGKGAKVAFLEQEAESAITDGVVIGPGRDAYTLPAEASGRAAVSLRKGQYVEFVLPAPANAVTVRYSIPDSPTGGGITTPLIVTADGGARTTMTLTSRYSWLYNQYPFTNDPQADLLHPDWWITECSCVPGATTPIAKPFRPSHFYDEQRLLLRRTYRAGDRIRLTATADTVIDLLDSEHVAPPRFNPRAVNVLAFGADPTGRRDSADAFDRAIGRARHGTVYIPPGTYQVNRHIMVDDVTIEGAGNWYTTVKGHGVGFYGDAARNVTLKDFAIEGDVRERVDADQVNGVGGAMSDSVVDGLYVHHTKVGMWFDGPMTNLTIRNSIITDQIADGVNFHTGVTNSRITGTFVRNSGDDGLALWSEKAADSGNVLDHNTVQTPVLANGIAVYGGADNTVSANLVADPIREGSALHAGSRFGAQPFTGHLWFTGNTTVRAGPLDLNWKLGLGALWLYALEGGIDADVRIDGNAFLDSTYNAIMLVSDWPVREQYGITNVHVADTRVDGTGTSVISARSSGHVTLRNVDARNVGAVGVNNCGSFGFPATGSELSLEDLGGNDGGWLQPWLLPNTITCDDHPPVVPPPPPASW